MALSPPSSLDEFAWRDERPCSYVDLIVLLAAMESGCDMIDAAPGPACVAGTTSVRDGRGSVACKRIGLNYDTDPIVDTTS